jgi:hypothetical protein
MLIGISSDDRPGRAIRRASDSTCVGLDVRHSGIGVAGAVLAW